MKKQIIGIDLDDTVIAFAEGFRAYHNRVYGSALEWHHLTSFRYDKFLGCTEEETTRRVVEFFHSDDHQKLEAIPGALEALQRLAVDYELIAITARDPERKERMLEIVKGHFGDLFVDMHFLGHQKKKGDLCAEIGVSFMVDDALHNAESVGELGIPVYLMDNPWNQCVVLPPNTTRVKDWKEILFLVFG